MQIPKEYQDREQSFLKHRVLKEYLLAWGHKLGSLARHGPVRLWYVDCFAGPWKQKDEALRDTSIDIGLRALEDAAESWERFGQSVKLGAVFVEKSKTAYQHLCEHLDQRDSPVEIVRWQGEFGEKVQDIRAHIGKDPAFVFIDPTGFKGVAMDYIATLMDVPRRDVLVNVMFNHINRFKDDERTFLREQMRDFFGLDESSLPPNLSEDQLLALYRSNLKDKCHIRYAADLAVPHPKKERTWFRLVIGGNHHEVLKVFRDVESKVIGREAASVRTGAKQRAETERTGQMTMGAIISPERDRWYEHQNRSDQQEAVAALRRALVDAGRLQIKNVWPDLLERFHITYKELSRLIVDAARAGELVIEPEQPRRRAVKDDDWISLPSPRT